MFAVLLTMWVVIIVMGDGDDDVIWLSICASYAVGFSVSAAVRNFRE